MSPAAGTRLGDHVAGLDHAPDCVLVIVGFAQKSGIPCGNGCAVATVALNISAHAVAMRLGVKAQLSP
jgi:hypothetical protein